MSAASSCETSSLTGRVLVVDDHARARESMADVLRHAGHQVQCCTCAAEALQLLKTARVDCIITDLKMPGMTGIEFIIVPGSDNARRRSSWSRPMLPWPRRSKRCGMGPSTISKNRLRRTPERLVSQAMRHGRLVESGAVMPNRGQRLRSPRCSAPARSCNRCGRESLQVGPTAETVLIMGESGTGKELVARAIHASSHRHATTMVSLNCPVLSAQLMESELFGHEKGAFTGADAPRTGRFETAHGGTILLDEVTEIDLSLQAKLLRVLQEKSFERVGSCKTIHVDVRVLATTNRDLHEEVAAGRFREDLYYRLAVLPLAVPPLRERREDVPELAAYFFKRSALRLGRECFCALDKDARAVAGGLPLAGQRPRVGKHHYPRKRADDYWPRNGRRVRCWLILISLREMATTPRLSEPLPVGRQPGRDGAAPIEATLDHYGGHRARTAKALGIGIRTLSGKLRQYGYAPREKSYAVSPVCGKGQVREEDAEEMETCRVGQDRVAIAGPPELQR